MAKWMAVISVLLVCGCKIIEYHPYDVDVHYHDINIDNIERITELCRGKDRIRFVWMGDSQRWYDETEDMVGSINGRDDIDFVMHGGDITDFGMNREFDWVHRIMRKLRVPYVALIGNHDILGNGYLVFKEMYGPFNYSFVAGKTKFICLNTNALEFDYSEPVPDFEFMLRELADTVDSNHTNTVVAMHSGPFNEQFNNNSANIFQYIITRMKDLRFCLHAHNHRLEVNDYFDDGVIYYGCASMKDRSYMIFTITADGYEYEVVDF